MNEIAQRGSKHRGSHVDSWCMMSKLAKGCKRVKHFLTLAQNRSLPKITLSCHRVLHCVWKVLQASSVRETIVLQGTGSARKQVGLCRLPRVVLGLWVINDDGFSIRGEDIALAVHEDEGRDSLHVETMADVFLQDANIMRLKAMNM